MDEAIKWIGLGGILIILLIGIFCGVIYFIDGEISFQRVNPNSITESEPSYFGEPVTEMTKGEAIGWLFLLG